MKNNSLAMISTIALVVAFGALIGYIEPSSCVTEQADGWSTCESAAQRSYWTFWIALSIAIASYGSYRIRRYLYRKTSDS